MELPNLKIRSQDEQNKIDALLRSEGRRDPDALQELCILALENPDFWRESTTLDEKLGRIRDECHNRRRTVDRQSFKFNTGPAFESASAKTSDAASDLLGDRDEVRYLHAILLQQGFPELAGMIEEEGDDAPITPSRRMRRMRERQRIIAMLEEAKKQREILKPNIDHALKCDDENGCRKCHNGNTDAENREFKKEIRRVYGEFEAIVEALKSKKRNSSVRV